MARWGGIAIGLVGGCATVTIDEFETCEIALSTDAPTAAPGDAVTWTGGPLTEVRDTRVTIGGVPALVLSVEREGCATCDQCRVDAVCSPCGLCTGEELDPDVRTACFGDPFAGTTGSCGQCVERLTFEVPADAPLGEQPVWVVNAHGTSTVGSLTVVAARSGGSGAAGPTGGSGAGP